MAEETYIELIDRLNREETQPPPKINGLPDFKVSHYKQAVPPSLDSIGSLAYDNPDLRYDFGPLQCWLAEHEGEPIQLSETNALKPGDRYLDIKLPKGEGEGYQLRELTGAIRDLTIFVEQYPKIDWLVGSSWLASVADGKIIGRYGFRASDVTVPPGVIEASLKEGAAKPNAGEGYMKAVEGATVKFFYASRDDFLNANSRP